MSCSALNHAIPQAYSRGAKRLPLQTDKLGGRPPHLFNMDISRKDGRTIRSPCPLMITRCPQCLKRTRNLPALVTASSSGEAGTAHACGWARAGAIACGASLTHAHGHKAWRIYLSIYLF
jgi:hypothetical protein